MTKRLLLHIFLLFSFIQISKSQSDQQARYTLTDSARISLLTNGPSNKEVYALFGHTAIRVNDPTLGLDYVFNYGLFSFKTPNFILRFIQGQTDYMVGAIPFQYYLPEYKERGVSITEQELNLSLTEKQHIFDALLINTEPQNREYRYNFLYDNCSTRPRDIIENSVQGKIVYTSTNKQQTYRDLLHECIDSEPWTRFGIILIIGSGADKLITDRQKDFIPRYLMDAYHGAIIKNTDGTQRELVLSENVILPSSESVESSNTANQPIIIGITLLSLTLLISILVYKKRWIVLGKLFDTVLFLSAGLAGCTIFFLMFFSEHPCTSPNWNIVWLNPLQLIIALLFFVKVCSKCVYYYHFINFVALTLFLLAWSLIPQQLEIAYIPFIASIAIRSGMNILQQKKLTQRAIYSSPRIK